MKKNEINQFNVRVRFEVTVVDCLEQKFGASNDLCFAG